MMDRRRCDDGGFSIVELLVSTTLLAIVMAIVFQALNPSSGAFRTQPETADVQQRLRVAADTLRRELLNAGSGAVQGRNPGPLTDFLPPLLPYRQGRRRPDNVGTYLTETITLLRGNSTAAQTTLAQPLPARSSSVQVNLEPGCPPGDPVCGFKTGMDVLVFDGTGSYDLFTILSLSGFSLNLLHNGRDSPKTYAASVTRILEATSRVYFLKSDAATGTYQLMQYNGAAGADVPVVDHVVGLEFEYLADPQPAVIRQPLTDPTGPWTTYGPAPPQLGENCLFVANGTATPSPRLALMGDGTSLVPLAASDLTDGPWCPDAVDPNRYDADLFRIRAVRVTIRVEAALAALRGPAGSLFSRAGTSQDGSSFVPDQEIRFEVAPRNLNLRR